MDIETAIVNFETELQKLGLNATGALLIQLNVQGQNYIKSYGNLNNLSAPGTIITAKRIRLTDFMEKEIALSNVKESTKKLHYDSLKLIKRYSSEIYIEELNSEYLQRLELYMKESRGLSINTIARHMKILKRYINVARKRQIIANYPFLNYTIKTEQTHRGALSLKELDLLEKYHEKLDEPNEVLNAFLFSCYTGLRYSDICSFTKQHIYTINRKKWIILRMNKTNKEVRIPISIIFGGKALQLTKAIKRSRGTLFRLRTNQQTNRILKKIAKQAGIKKKITFHMARHTCATLLLYQGVSITTVQTLLGHQNVKTTQIYSAVTDLTLERELKKGNQRLKKTSLKHAHQ